MMKPKDSLPGVAILMLDMALSSLDRAAEAQSIEIAREKISEAQKEINQVLTLAKEAAGVDAD
jgi:hypothetical protein